MVGVFGAHQLGVFRIAPLPAPRITRTALDADPFFTFIQCGKQAAPLMRGQVSDGGVPVDAEALHLGKRMLFDEAPFDGFRERRLEFAEIAIDRGFLLALFELVRT